MLLGDVHMIGARLLSLICLLSLAVLSPMSAHGAAGAKDKPGTPDLAGPIEAKPSENKGRTGSYQCHTSHAGCDYWVYVPKSYSE